MIAPELTVSTNMSVISQPPFGANATRTVEQKAAESPQELPFDIAQVRRRCMGNAAFAEQLLKSFESRFPSDLADVQQLLAIKDSTRLTLLVHQMKGAAANMAAARLGAILQEIEALSRANQLDDVSAWVPKLHAEW